MAYEWSFGTKIGAGFAVAVAFTALNSVLSVLTMREIVATKDAVLERDASSLIGAAELETAAAEQVSALRGFLLTGESRYTDQIAVAYAQVSQLLRDLRAKVPAAAANLAAIEISHAEYTRVGQEVAEMRGRANNADSIEAVFVQRLRPRREQLKQQIEVFVQRERIALSEAKQAAAGAVEQANRWIVSIAVAAALFSGLIALLLTRALKRQIGSAVGQVQSSSAELQSAANLQATGAREQASAMNEINTTISELLTTSRQIAESARRVTAMADQTASSARLGDGTLNKARDAFATIQRQVEQIVSHMLDLGKKTQQIGVVLEIVAELAEQTNILAINATIEAIGAGDAGKRFAVVADEIRRLADRVSISTKEVRSLIEEVRGAANTTVMATEIGSKTVDAGSRHFVEVTSSFRQISDLVDTTTEAAREIELSTKQQSGAVEQVNVAMQNVAQATRESEATSAQTLQTASLLAGVSKELLRVLQPG
jgi:methyl-accepting chemotaxis protein